MIFTRDAALNQAVKAVVLEALVIERDRLHHFAHILLRVFEVVVEYIVCLVLLLLKQLLLI